ncbi:MAG TPA: AraC family transcriptional regulator [Candidatus Eisenbacteria bacterium]|nr:AraC family transcriptional regulator [Candidatus Eisenbacteria bacterium]
MSATPLYIPGSAGAYFGHVLRTRRAGRFLLRESRYVPALRMPTHYHPRAYFSYIVDGSMRERDPRGETEHRAGTLHFHAAGEPHSGHMGSSGTTCLSIILCEELSGRIAPSCAASRHTLAPEARIARRLRRELHTDDSASELALESLGLELVATLMRGERTRDRQPPRWLREVRDHLHAHALEQVRLADLSALAGIHEVHLVRAFRRHFGATPGAYQRELRIEHARRMLADSGTSIADLALAAGFSSQAHFTRVFHHLTGTTPAAYRRARARRAS